MKVYKVYFLLPDLSAGGAERVTITIARLLQKEGYSIEFLNLGYPKGEMQSWIEPEFKMTCLRFDRVLKAFPALYSFMKSNPNSIYFSSREHVSLVGMLAAKMTKSTIIVRIPNMPKNKLRNGIDGLKAGVIKVINKWLLKTVKVIIAQNEEMRKQLLDHYQLPPSKILTINNPIDEDYIRSSTKDSINPFDSSELNFLNISNIAYSKGIDTLMDAWPKVKASIPNAHMYIVGRNSSDYALDIMKKANYLKDFTFAGFQSNAYSYLKYCDVFVLSSRMEGFPNVILEALCLNRPIASTSCVAVIMDIIHPGINGYYCKIEDNEALADCMIKASRLKKIENNYQMFDKNLLINCFKILDK